MKEVLYREMKEIKNLRAPFNIISFIYVFFFSRKAKHSGWLVNAIKNFVTRRVKTLSHVADSGGC